MTANLRKATFKALLLILAATLTIALINRSNSAAIFITLNVGKQTYGICDQASIWGNVTFSAGVGGGLVPDALVAIEVDNPKGIPVILRTCTTGFLPTASEIIVLNLTPCDQTGNPLTTFKNGTLAYFKISLNNTSTSPKPAEITLNIFDARNLAYETFTAFKGLLYSGTTNLLISDPIPQDIPNGTATAYLNIFTALPSVGGFAYCPEESATFAIGSPLPMWSPGPHPPSGFYNLIFLIDNYATTRLFRHGNYSVFANCKYETETASASTAFEIVLTGDINRDGAVDIYDAILLANAFGTKLGDPRWNPNADLNHDGKVDIYDAIIIANHYGNKA
jgi:hypothetical protein